MMEKEKGVHLSLFSSSIAFVSSSVSSSVSRLGIILYFLKQIVASLFLYCMYTVLLARERLIGQ